GCCRTQSQFPVSTVIPSLCKSFPTFTPFLGAWDRALTSVTGRYSDTVSAMTRSDD
ncbi:hypothetical protein OS493_040006, partial [Desmophyllum pertusum]